MGLFQIIYLSSASDKFKPLDLPQILTQARERNKRDEISGLLIFSEGVFLQVLEGRKTAVEQLIKKIELDPRHKNIKVLFFKDIEEKEFENWAMGFVDIKLLGPKTTGFVNLQTELTALINDDTTAHKALRRFMDGNYRKHVES